MQFWRMNSNTINYNSGNVKWMQIEFPERKFQKNIFKFRFLWQLLQKFLWIFLKFFSNSFEIPLWTSGNFYGNFVNSFEMQFCWNFFRLSFENLSYISLENDLKISFWNSSSYSIRICDCFRNSKDAVFFEFPEKLKKSSWRIVQIQRNSQISFLSNFLRKIQSQGPWRSGHTFTA